MGSPGADLCCWSHRAHAREARIVAPLATVLGRAPCSVQTLHRSRRPALDPALPHAVHAVQVLTALAAGEKGARSMYLQLRGDDRFAAVAWRRMFQLLVTVIRQYVPGGHGWGAVCCQLLTRQCSSLTC